VQGFSGLEELDVFLDSGNARFRALQCLEPIKKGVDVAAFEAGEKGAGLRIRVEGGLEIGRYLHGRR